MSRRPGRGGAIKPSGLVPVAGGFSQSIRAGSTKDATGSRKGRQFRLKIVIDESSGPPEVRRAIALSRLADITAMRDALVELGRGAQAEYLMRKAGAVADDAEKFHFAIAAANVVMSRPSEKASEASTRFSTWGQLARAWCTQELARLYPNAGYAKKSAEDTDEPRVEYICKFIGDVPLATFNDDDYWRAMRPARARCKTDSTFKAYAQVCRRVLKIGVELKIIPAWPLSAVCKLPKIAKGSGPEFPFLYPDEYVRLMRCVTIRFEYRVLWGFIIREGLRISEAYRIRWEHLAQLSNGRWLLDVPDTKTGRALNFVLNAGTGEVLAELRRRMPELSGPFAWLKITNVKKAAEDLRRHIELSGTTRERLLFTDGRLRRLREHDLRSTFVTWCKLGGVDNETIAQHTGHESNTMIARYNRSKATIEHLGLSPYLRLDEAFGELALALGMPELGPGGEAPRMLGAGEQPNADWATENASGNRGPAPLQATEIDETVNSASAVTSALQSPPDAASGELTGVGAQPARINERPGQGPASSTPGAALPGAHLLDGSMCRGREKPSKAVEKREATAGGTPLNTCNSRDASRDARHGGECHPVPENEESSMFPALVRERGVEPPRLAALEPKSETWRPERTKPAETGDEPAPERTGSDRASHPGVTLLGQLQAAARAALDERNWAALRALEPLIDAEVARLEEVARAAPPEPVRLEVVRAQRKGGAS